MDVGQLDLELVVFGVGALLLAGLAAIKTSHRLGTPVLLLFVGLGVLIGEGGLGVAFDDAQLTAQAGTLFLAVILWDGGFTTSLSEIRPVAAPAAASPPVAAALPPAEAADPADPADSPEPCTDGIAPSAEPPPPPWPPLESRSERCCW